jgi:hypothetical protein
MKIVDEMPKEDGKVIRLSVWQQYDGSQEIDSETLRIIDGVLHYYNEGFEDWLEDSNNLDKAVEVKYVVL